MLQVNPDFGAVIGVEIGETGVRVEGFDLRLRVAGVAEVGLHPQHHDADVTIEETVKAIEKIQAQFSAEGRRLLGVGIAIPGSSSIGSTTHGSTLRSSVGTTFPSSAWCESVSELRSLPRTVPRRWGRWRCGSALAAAHITP